jgi:hypothetical protein
MSRSITVIVALLVATLCTATATAVHVGTVRTAAVEEARTDLQRRATELHLLAIRDASGDPSETVEVEFKEPRKVYAE